MQKPEALAVLKEIVARHAVSPNWLSLKEKEPNKYELTIKGEYNKEIINIIVREKNLTVIEINGFLTIC